MKQRLQPLLLLASLLVVSPFAFGQATKDFDEPPTPVKAIAPAYPAQMKRDNVSGLVSIKVIIDENGDVAEQAVAKSSRPEFEGPAMDAVKRWKFKPAKKAGVAVKATVTIPIKFSAGS